MSRTQSTMLALGTVAKDFRLPDVVSGKAISLDDFADKRALLVMFICVHCPYVQHVKKELAQIGQDYGKAVGIVAINSNDVAAYPDDSPKNMLKMALELGFAFPFCYDETQEIARAYTAVCTPDIFLFDHERRLVYRGQIDGARPGNDVPVSGGDLRAALDALLSDRPISEHQRPSLGCNIKWKSGNEPSW
jgi:thiol-disulfide isomerase/thioredoxin